MSATRSLVFKNRGALLAPLALALVVFGRPSPASAVAGILIATAGEALRVWAVGFSGATTRADVVTAPTLVTAGPYAWIRNPLYAGNAIIAFGYWVALVGAVSARAGALLLAIALSLVAGVYATIVPLEEEYLARQFGLAYERYRRAVPRLLPRRPLPNDERTGTWRSEVIVRAEAITLAFFVVMFAVVLLKLGPLRGLGVYF